MTGGQDGTGSDFYTSAMVFKDGAWQFKQDLPNPLFNHCQVNINDQVIITGGRYGEDAMKNTWALRETDWEDIGDMTEGRYFHSCAEFSGKLFSIGGKATDGTILNTVEVYDPISQTWSKGPDLPEGLYSGQAVTYQGSLYYMAGRNSNESPNTKVLRLSKEDGDWEVVSDVSVKEENRGVFPALFVTSNLVTCQ